MRQSPHAQSDLQAGVDLADHERLHRNCWRRSHALPCLCFTRSCHVSPLDARKITHGLVVGLLQSLLHLLRYFILASHDHTKSLPQSEGKTPRNGHRCANVAFFLISQSLTDVMKHPVPIPPMIHSWSSYVYPVYLGTLTFASSPSWCTRKKAHTPGHAPPHSSKRLCTAPATKAASRATKTAAAHPGTRPCQTRAPATHAMRALSASGSKYVPRTES